MLGIARIYEVAGHRLLNNIHKRQLDGWIFSELVSHCFLGTVPSDTNYMAANSITQR